MNEKIARHMDMLFETAPKTRKAMELKEEMTRNAMDKYQDLLSEGRTQEDAFQNVISSIGDVSDLFEELEENIMITISQEDRRRKAVVQACAVGLYIFAGVVFFFFAMLDGIIITKLDLSMMGLILAGIICIIPTIMLVYMANMYPVYDKKEENIVENYKEWKSGSEKEKAVRSSINSIIWTLAVIFYFLISFTTMKWYITWVVFLIAGCVQSVVRLMFSLRQN